MDNRARASCGHCGECLISGASAAAIVHECACADIPHMQEIKRVVRQTDRATQREKCTERAPLIAEVVCRGGSWMRLWDAALHLGTRHTEGLQALSRMLVHHTVEDPSHVLCVMGVPLIPTLLDIPKRAPSRTWPE